MIENKRIEEILSFYRCPCEVVKSSAAGIFADYVLNPVNGTTINKLRARLDDIQLLTGQNATVEVENGALILRLAGESRKTYNFYDYANNLERVAGALAIGISPAGEYIQDNIFNMPHLLVAGATGSGKSIFIHTVIHSLRARGCMLRLVDTKKVELSIYDGINGILSDTITDAREAAAMLENEVDEMLARFEYMQSYGVRHFLVLPEGARLNAHVIIIDELADLMLNKETRKSVENSIVGIAQLGRAAGVHLVLATQRPSADVLTGLIKANIPCRLAFRTASRIDSAVIGIKGAERLTGKGDAIFQGSDGIPRRVQSFNIDNDTLYEFFTAENCRKRSQQEETHPRRRGFLRRLFS